MTGERKVVKTLFKKFFFGHQTIITVSKNLISLHCVFLQLQKINKNEDL